MTVEAAFLQSILDEPDDDTPRRVYADWLMEQGGARAARGEFIDVQIQLARWENEYESVDAWGEAMQRRPRLEARAAELQAQYGEEWQRPFRGFAESWQFRRGFVEQVTVGAAAFLHAEQLFQLSPVQHVCFKGAARYLAELASCRHLARLSTIDLRQNSLYAHHMPILLASQHLTRLRRLYLGHNRVGDSGVRTLAASRYLAQLTDLDLSHCGMTTAGLRALIGSPYRGRLRTLKLEGKFGRVADSNALVELLQSSSDPAVLRTVLEVVVAGVPRECNNRQARRLAQDAASSPAGEVPVLEQGLRGSHRKVRAAAAHLLGRVRGGAPSAMPGLVKHLYEREPGVRDRVAATLAGLLSAAPTELRSWLCVLANPLLSPEVNLHRALEDPRLPGRVQQAFAALCARRAAWRAGHAGESPAASSPHGGHWSNVRSVWKTIETAVGYAERSALKHRSPTQEERAVAQAARDKEMAWLVARLCELLQRG
jgi:uncharacterized protein (TIGR02996 family)